MENICQGNLSGDFSYIMDIFLLPRVTGAAICYIKTNSY